MRRGLLVAFPLFGVWCSVGCTTDDPNADYMVNASIWGSPEGQIFVAGYNGTDRPVARRGFLKTLTPEGLVTLHDTEEELWDVWGTNSSDFFALGSAASHFTVFHQHGGQWDAWNSSDVQWAIGRIWGTAPDDVFGVDGRGNISHFGGTSWERMQSPTEAALEAVWGTSSQNVIAVGAGGTIVRYDGSVWTLEASPSTAKLRGIWGSSPTDVFVIGETVAERTHVILHYDGNAWSPVHEGEPNLLGIHGSGPSCVYAVGGKRDGNAVRSGVLFFDGKTWIQTADDAGQFLWDVWVTPACGFYAVGPDDTLIQGPR
jgi:hypothetical protein